LSPAGADAADLEQAQLLKSTYSDTNTRQNNRRLNKRTGFCIFGVVLFLFWVYLVEKYTTLNPAVVYMHTARYLGPGTTLYPPDGWKPSSRVVVTLTTRPDRLSAMLKPTLLSVLSQDLAPDALYLNIPEGTNVRSGEEYRVPDDLAAMQDLTILRCKDRGPVTKLYPALEAESNPETIVISVDDDKIYPPELLRTLAWHLENTVDTAVSCCGWSVWWWPNHWMHVTIPYYMRGSFGVYADVLQGVCGVGYRKRFFNVTELQNPPDACYTVDDVWIAGSLATHGIRRAIISARMDPAQRPEVNAKTDKWSLSGKGANGKGNDVYDQCIASIESRYGEWTKVRNYP